MNWVSYVLFFSIEQHLPIQGQVQNPHLMIIHWEGIINLKIADLSSEVIRVFPVNYLIKYKHIEFI